MELSFLNLWFLSFLPLGSIPILIHLYRKKKHKIIYWAAMEFLLNAEAKSSGKRKLRNLLLLILRTLMVLLIVIACARPLLRSSKLGAFSGRQNIHAIIILDDSFSMAYTKVDSALFEKAIAVSKDIITSLKPGDAISVILASSPAHTLGNASYNRFDVAKEMENLKVSYGTTDYIGAFLLANEVMNSISLPRKEVYIIADLQKNGFVKKAEGTLENDPLKFISDKAKIYVVQVGSKEDIQNAAITAVGFPRNIVDTLGETKITVEVQNFGKLDMSNLTLELFINDNLITRKPLFIKSYSHESIDFYYQFPKPGNFKGYVVLYSDSLTPDNRFYFNAKVHDNLKVLSVEGETRMDKRPETYFLDSALHPYDKGIVSIVNSISHGLGRYRENLSEFNVIVLANVKSLTTYELQSLEQYVSNGGSLFISLGDLIDADFYNKELFKNSEGLLPCSIGEIKGDINKKKLFYMSAVNIKHPSLKIFAEPEVAELKNTAFYQYYQAKYSISDDRISVLCSFKNGDALLMEKKYGKGKVILFTSSVDDAWTNFPNMGPMYLPYFQQIIYYLAYLPKSPVLVNNPIMFDMSFRDFNKECEGKLPKVMNPMGEASIVTSKTIKDGYLFTCDKTKIPGIYSVISCSASASTIEEFCVNVDSKESNLEKITEGEFQSMYTDVKMSFLSADREIKQQLVAEHVGREFWKDLIYLLFAFGIAEIVISQIFSKR